jgi:phosphoribosylaminoimidazole-succinocarboxamide synthase
MKLLREGSVKRVYEDGPDELVFEFSNGISVFDCIIPNDVPRKGESLCRTGAYWFEQVEAADICQTHYLGLDSPREMRVERVRVIDDYERVDEEMTNVLIPLEVVCRHHAAGSLMDRVEEGKIEPAEVGFPEGYEIEGGEKLPEPYVEFTTKLEEIDRKLTEDEAQQIAGLTDDDLEQIKQATLAIDELIEEQVEDRDLIHADGKKEFAWDGDRNLMVVDCFGTGDEDRFWDKQAFEERGERVEMCKEFVRQHYRDSGFHAELMEAREAGDPEPEIPPMPDDLIEETSNRYVELYEKITGKGF